MCSRWQENHYSVEPRRIQRLANTVREQLTQDVEDSPEVSVENENEQVNIGNQEDDEETEGTASSTAGGYNMEVDGRVADRVERERARGRGY